MPTLPPAGRRRIAAVLVLGWLAGATVLAGSAGAADFRSADGMLEVRGPVDDDIYATAGEVRVTGAVVGDVFAAAGTVALEGSAAGSFNAAGDRITIPGEVAGTARAAGRTIDLEGAVGGDLMAMGSDVRVGREGVVGRDLLVGAQDVVVSGRVVRRLVGRAETVTITGTVAGVEVSAGRLVLEEGARVDGDLVYTSATSAEIDSEAVVTGRVVQRPPADPPSSAWGAVKSILGAAGLGLVLLWLAPPALPAAAEALRRAPFVAAAAGVGGAIAVPILIVLLIALAAFLDLGVTLVLLLAAGSGILGLAAKVVVGLATGALVLRRPRLDPVADFRGSALSLLAGVLIIGILSAIPYLGGVILVLVLVAGFGAGLAAFLRWRRAARSGSWSGTASFAQ